MFPSRYFPGRYFPGRYFPGRYFPSGLAVSAPSMPFDVTDDFDVVDGIETVLYQRYSTSGSLSAQYTGVKAWKTATRKSLSPLASGGQVVIRSCRWHLKPSTLSIEPRKGDRIVTATHGTWEVLSCDVEVWDTEYVAACQKVT